MIEHISEDGSVGLRVRPGRLVHAYRGKAVAAHVPLLRTFTDAVRGTPAVQLIVLQPRSIKDAPDAEFRTAAAQFIEEQPDPFIASAVVVKVDGFLGAVARSVMIGFNWAGDSQRRNFSHVDEGVAWLAERAPALQLRVADVALDVDELIRQLDARVRAP